MTTAFLDRHSKVFGRSATLVLKIAGLTASESEGRGAHIIDSEGRDWLDFGSFGIHLLGHCNPAIVEVARAQVSRFGLSSKILANEWAVSAGEKLCALTGGRHQGVLFANSGSEAIEITIKMCRMATGRRRFVALDGAYHGRTDGALQLSSSYVRHAGAPAAGAVDFVRPGDTERLADLLRTGAIAGVYVEPVQGEGGIRPVDTDFLWQVRELCDAYGTLMVCDEIQTGLGRAGQLVHCPSADIITYGKTLAGGIVPVAAVVFDTAKIGNHARDPIASASSYAGGALAGAVAAAVVDTVSKPGFTDDVKSKGAFAMAALRRAFAGFEGIVDIRGSGLMIGLEFTSPGLVGETILEAAERNLLVTFCLSAPTVLRLYPPAVSTQEEIADAVTRLREAVDAAWATTTAPTGDQLSREAV